LLAAASLVYARSGTILLGALSDAKQTAAYTLASTFALGLLLIPNAITTGLLPRLSTEPSALHRRRLTRRARGLGTGQALAVLAVGSAVARLLLPLAVGQRHGAAVLPLYLRLCADRAPLP